MTSTARDTLRSIRNATDGGIAVGTAIYADVLHKGIVRITRAGSKWVYAGNRRIDPMDILDWWTDRS